MNTLENWIIKKKPNKSNSTDLLTFKYHPKKLNDIVGNELQMNEIKQWLSNYKNKVKNTPKCLFLYGPSGTGKTSCAHLLLKEYGYQPKEFNASSFRNKTMIKKYIQESMTSQFFSFESTQVILNGLVMDEVDGMTSGDNGGLSEFVKMVELPKSNNFSTPIICISNVINSKLSSIIKLSHQVKFSKVGKKSMMNKAISILKKENLPHTSLIVEKLVKSSQGDVRCLMHSIETYKGDISTTVANNDNKIEDIHIVSHKKDIEYDIYESTKQLFSKNNSFQKSFLLYDIESSVIPLLVHENIYHYIPKKQDFNDIVAISESFSYGDVILNNIHQTKKWELNDTHAFYSTIYPSKKMNKTNKKNINIKFSSFLNRMSVIATNRKRLKAIQEKLNVLVNYESIMLIRSIYLGKLLKTPLNILKETGWFQSLCKIDIDFNFIDNLYKYSGIYKTKFASIYTTKFKKEVQKIFKEYL